MNLNWQIGRRWAVVQCVPNSEGLAASSAAELGFTVFWPRYQEKRLQSHRKPVDAVLSYLPGYTFVQDSRYAQDGRPLSLWELGKAKGVASVLKVGSEYATVPDTDAIMQELLKMADDNGFVTREVAKTPISLFRVGDKAVIREGPFAGFEAVIDKLSKGRNVAKVWVQIFGRPTALTLETEQLKTPKARKVAA